eukprot:CAMPEP_0172658814 /NCGR_PEP_ID=MMETSP1074-20121228/3000_1 /TAXON_ID=2916 /ORGANISM="Ceratium fusus, Strain PA161109" /LENGTH=42 /DNA_ID= /DNA_START= /DNA_END= /DNA_ORIENTATION=
MTRIELPSALELVKDLSHRASHRAASCGSAMQAVKSRPYEAE